jgi:hypothetical protein
MKASGAISTRPFRGLLDMVGLQHFIERIVERRHRGRILRDMPGKKPSRSPASTAADRRIRLRGLSQARHGLVHAR